MWTQTTTSANDINLAAMPVDYLAELVNKLSSEDFQQFQRRLKPSLGALVSLENDDDSESLGTSIDQLTRREHEVLVLVASGYSRKEIGAALKISENTAASHIASIYRKLEICSIAEATNIAIRVGII